MPPKRRAKPLHQRHIRASGEARAAIGGYWTRARSMNTAGKPPANPNPNPNPSGLNLQFLPTEVLLRIFWFSRELRLSQTSRRLRIVLPPFVPVARSLAVMALCGSLQERSREQPVVGETLLWFRDYIFRAVQERCLKLPGADLAFPLAEKERIGLLHDLLSTGWATVRWLHDAHVYIYRVCLQGLDLLVSRGIFACSAPLKPRKIKQLIRSARIGFVRRTRSTETVYPGSPEMMPEKVMPLRQFGFNGWRGMTNTIYPLDFEIFQAESCLSFTQIHLSPLLSLNYTDARQLPSDCWTRHDACTCTSILLPRKFLATPSTPSRQAMLKYLIKDTGAVSRKFSRGSMDSVCMEIVHRAVLGAVACNDEELVMLLLKLTDHRGHFQSSHLCSTAQALTPSTCRLEQIIKLAVKEGHVDVLRALWDDCAQCCFDFATSGCRRVIGRFTWQAWRTLPSATRRRRPKYSGVADFLSEIEEYKDAAPLPVWSSLAARCGRPWSSRPAEPPAFNLEWRDDPRLNARQPPRDGEDV